MKNNKLTKTGILLLFGISILFWNCQKDETIEHTHESIDNTDSKLSRVSINDLIKNDETFSKLSENYLTDKISKKGFSAKNSSNGNDLIITSDSINVVEKENYKSYTIRIKRSGYEHDTENLIIEQKDSIESAYILSYDFDNEWVANRLKGIHNPPKGKIYYSDFDTANLASKSTTAKSSGSCNYLTITIIAPCGCGHYYRSQCNGCSYGNQYPTSYTTSQLVCDSGGGSDNDFGGPLETDNGNEGGFGGGGGGGPSPSDSNDNSETQSNLEDMAEFVEFKLNALITNLELNTDQAKWVGENVEESLDIYDFVARDNVWAEEAKGFAKLAIEAWTINKDTEVDFVNEIIKDPSFIGTKADCILKQLLNQTGYFKEVMDAFTNNNSKYKIKFIVGELSRQNQAAGADAETGPPDENNIITITIRPDVINKDALEIASVLLHEGVHAQLHRILASGNKAEYNLSSSDYNWLIDLEKFWSNNSEIPTSQHDFMTVRYVDKIANSMRKFDGSIYPITNYMFFGWDGLYDEGKNRGLIDKTKFEEFRNLATIPLTDNHKTSCD